MKVCRDGPAFRQVSTGYGEPCGAEAVCPEKEQSQCLRSRPAKVQGGVKQDVNALLMRTRPSA